VYLGEVISDFCIFAAEFKANTATGHVRRGVGRRRRGKGGGGGGGGREEEDI
jgi:hypothetical protein